MYCACLRAGIRRSMFSVDRAITLPINSRASKKVVLPQCAEVMGQIPRVVIDFNTTRPAREDVTTDDGSISTVVLLYSRRGESCAGKRAQTSSIVADWCGLPGTNSSSMFCCISNTSCSRDIPQTGRFGTREVYL